mmetsp:Transcript_31459/g.96225  ORF Transcript_31459/g.96225 Transcript_31459/m.96225 type:complete len:201 (+) Transcript_31459:1019-1621(+)|eukprot:scaffold33233_cov31-Tisochrysis_lutea.AAC.2
MSLAHTGRADEHESAQGTVWGLQASTRNTYSIGNHGERFILSDYSLGEARFHVEETLALCCHKPCGRDSRCTRHNLGNVGRRHLLREQGVVVLVLAARASCGLAPLRKLLLEPRNDGVLELARPHQIALAFSHAQLCTCLLQVAARQLTLLQSGALRRPCRIQLLNLGLLGVERLAEGGPACLDMYARFAPECLKLNLHG